MGRSLALATLAALLCACVADSGSGAASDSATVASQHATIDEPEPGDPSDVTYIEWKDTGFTVIKSATADALFESVATCTSEEGGYTVEYPVSWHTNEGGQAPGCSWFAPEPFAQAPARLVALVRPVEVPIGLSVYRTALGHIPEWPRLLTEQVVIGGVDGGRSEVLVPGPAPQFIYGYEVWLEPAFNGLKFLAGTTSEADGDYVLNKAVLDRMMASLEFTAGAPAPVAAPTPGPTYVERAGYPFTVIDNPEADALFATPDTCTNPVAGYTVTFPDDWYTNTEIGETPACSWFTPDYFEVTDPAEVPDEIWISIAMVDGVVAYTGLTQHFLNEEVLLGGMTARRVESNPSPNDRPDYRAYDYHVNMGSQGQGPSFLASVDSDAAGDYELGKAVLDRIMASLHFHE